MMVDVSEDNEAEHEQYLKLFDIAILECDRGNNAVLAAINKFGLQDRSLDGAREIIKELSDIYREEYASR